MTLDGPLVGAAVSINHTNAGETREIQVRSHVADLVTDDRGAFETLTGTKSGFFIITTRGGSFRDYATGETVVLDEADGLTALLYIDTLEDLTTGLVTPFTHLTHKLIDARTQARLDIDLVTSHTLVNDHVNRHLGELTWERAAPADLAAPQPSPTTEVRAAFVLGAWSLLAHRDRDRRRRDRAAGQCVHAGPRPRPRAPPPRPSTAMTVTIAPPARGSSSPRVRRWRRAARLAARVRCPSAAPPATPTLARCAPAWPPRSHASSTTTAPPVATRPGSRPRLARLRARDGRQPQSALVRRHLAPILNQTPPTITFGPTPAPGALVRGAIALTAVATTRQSESRAGRHPRRADRHRRRTVVGRGHPRHHRHRRPAHRHRHRPRRRRQRRHRDPGPDRRQHRANLDHRALGLALVDGAAWWTSAASPSLTSTAGDLHGPITVRAYVLGVEVASTVSGPGGWNLTLPVGARASRRRGNRTPRQ